MAGWIPWATTTEVAEQCGHGVTTQDVRRLIRRLDVEVVKGLKGGSELLIKGADVAKIVDLHRQKKRY